MGWAKRDIVNQHIDKMLEQGVIEPAESPYNAPIVLVPKKDGSTRFCNDFRRLNLATRKNSHSLPRIDEIFDTLGGAEWYCSLDMYSGFWQCPLDPADRDKTAFSVPGRAQFRWTVLCFGLCNAPATFSLLVGKVLAGLLYKTCLAFLDDVICYGTDFDSTLKNLEEVFCRFRGANLKLKPEKCKLFFRKVSYLGHVISPDGVSCDESKVAAVKDWPTPSCLKDLQAFLGTANYYRKFIPDFATTAYPLTRMTRKKIKFVWTDDCQLAFDSLKNCLVRAPILSYPQEDAGEFILDTDCSSFGAGAVLSQAQNGIEKVISYASTTLNKQQRAYCATFRELFAIIFAVKFFKPYLWGRKFRLRTDHASLRWLINFREPEGIVARWISILDTYDFVIEHRPGSKHGNADGLSRIRRKCNRDLCSTCGDNLGKDETAAALVAALQPENENNSTSPWLESYSTEDLRDLQMKDSCISTVLRWKETLENPPKGPDLLPYPNDVRTLCSQWKLLFVIDGVLHREFLPSAPSGNSVFQIVLPFVLRREMYRQLHELRTGGHLGKERTYKKLRARFYWPNMHKQIADWCRFCKPCAATKTHHGRHKAELCKMLCGEPMDRIGIDHVGPLPRTPEGNEYLLVVTDYFSKWAEAYPVPNVSAAVTADVLVTQFITRFGTPFVIHTDQGSAFESELFQNMTKLFEIEKTRTTPYHPRSDGLTEKFNGTLQRMLKAFVDSSRTDWQDHLPYLLMAYRSTIHESTGYTPNRLMLGRELFLPSDLMFGRPPNSPRYNCYVEFVQWFDSATAESFEFAREQLGKSAVKQKRNFNASVTPVTFNVGDYVWFYYPPNVRKLSTGWTGPWEVVDRKTDFLYCIRKVGSENTRMSHIDNLHPYLRESEDNSSVRPDSPATLDPLDILQSDNFVMPENESVCESTNVMVESGLHPKPRKRPTYLDDYVT